MKFFKQNLLVLIVFMFFVLFLITTLLPVNNEEYQLSGYIYTGIVNLQDFEDYFPETQPAFLIFDASGKIQLQQKASSSVFAHKAVSDSSATYTLHDTSNPRWPGSIYKNVEKSTVELSNQDNPHDDIHGPLLTSRNTWVLPSYKLHTIDNQKIESFYIEEQDTYGNVLWSWDSIDHVPISYSRTKETRVWWLENKINDYFHGNSIEETLDGNYLVSGRNTDQILKIHRITGDIIWTLGGLDSDFVFRNDPLNGFRHQHSVHELENGNILLYDNGNTRTVTESRVAEYAIDYTEKTATLVWSYSDGRFTPATGSVQRLPDGNTLVGWGVSMEPLTKKRPRISIINQKQEILKEIYLGDNENIYGAYYSPYLVSSHLSH